MPRLTYRDRLQTLLDRPLTTRDRSFVESLLAYYNRKGKLTAGRARCVPELEERYSPANLAAAKEQTKEIHNRLSVGDKYAQKVLASHHAAPKYAPGSMVTFRASAAWTHRTANGATLPTTAILLVIAPNAGPITSAAKGAKIYKVLPVGCPETILIEERFIMKARKLGKK
jgi:hypothetical protein